MSGELLAAALRYAAKGWRVLQVKPGGNAPMMGKGWQHNASSDPATVRDWWTKRPDANIGIVCDGHFGFALDVDDLAALDFLPEALPATLTEDTPSGGRHYIFRHPTSGPLDNKDRALLKWLKGRGYTPAEVTFPDGKTKVRDVEIRGACGYIAVAPSVRSDREGECYAWHDQDAPIAEAPAWLLDAIQGRATKARNAPGGALAKKLARAENLARTLPPAVSGHGGHDATFKVACDLIRCGLTPDQALGPLRLFNERCEPPWSEDELIHKLRDAAEERERERPDSILIGQDIDALADAAEAALLAAGEPFYQRGGELVRATTEHPQARERWLVGAPDAPIIARLAVSTIWARSSAVAKWLKYDARAEGLVPVMPPRAVADVLSARGRWAFPALDGIATAPFLRADGTVCVASGYDPQTGVILAGGATVEVPEAPTLDDARAAWTTLAEPLAEFPFVDAADRAAAIAAILSLCARPAIDGCVPLFGVVAPTAGTGKGLLVEVCATIGSGRGAATMAPPGDDDEWRKRIYAICSEGHAAIHIDNVVGSLGCAALASALTAREVSDRVLGASRIGRAPQRAVWFASGNNIAYVSDLARRVVPIRLDSRSERPEDRTFARDDLLGWVRARRDTLTGAALTILRGYHVAARPAQGLGPVLGSFEAWDRLVRGAVAWVSGVDCLAGRAELRATADPERAELEAALAAWAGAYERRWSTLRDIVDHIDRQPGDPAMLSLRDALVALSRPRDGRLEPHRLATALRRHLGRPAGGLVLESDRPRNVTLWRAAVAFVAPCRTPQSPNQETVTSHIMHDRCGAPDSFGGQAVEVRRSATSATFLRAVGDGLEAGEL